MAKLVVIAEQRRSGRPKGAVLAVLPDWAQFGKKEVLEQGLLRIVVKDTEPHELKKLVEFYQEWAPEDEKWVGLINDAGNIELRCTVLEDAFVDRLIKKAENSTAPCNKEELLSWTELVPLPEVAKGKKIRRSHGDSNEYNR